MSGPVISVEVVTHRTQMRRFVDVPYLLFGSDPRWARPVRAFDQWRFDERRHPFFDTGTAVYFLARSQGQPAGRVTAHVAASGDTAGWFGFLAAPDDIAVTSALLDAARDWLDEQGVTSMTGPVSWTADEEFGVPVSGAEVPGVTGRPWHPAYYARHLESLGFEAGDVRHTYRIPTALTSATSTEIRPVPGRSDPVDTIHADTTPGVDAGTDLGVEATGSARQPATVPPPSQAEYRSSDDVPAHAGRFVDRRIVLDRIAAVPDVSATLAHASLRSAWRQARRASAGDFTTAVCVRCDGDAQHLVPRLVAAAGSAGYADVIVPWAPPGMAPETTHRVFSRRW